MSKENKSTELNPFNELKPNQVLSDLINLDEKKIFLKSNKKALIAFEEFIQLQKCKSRNGQTKLSLHLLNINANNNLEKFKKNPILILKSYDKNLFDEKKRIFKNQTLGVDEGLITLPKKDLEINPYDKFFGNETSRLKNNLNLKSTEEESNNNFGRKNPNNNNVLYSAKSLSTRKKLINISGFERGKELVTVNKRYLKRKSEQNYINKIKKMKEDFEQQLNYNFELKKLNNWDFLNLPRDKNFELNKTGSSTKKKTSIINFTNLNEADSSNMGWLLNIRNDKEKLKVVSRIKQLNDFFIGFGKEQDAIFMQTMKINKKGFIFDAFYKSKDELKDIKIDEKEIISGVNFYREVMKVKTKREDMFKSEICECAEKLRMAKIEKQKCIIDSYELLNELEELKKKEIDVINELNLNSKNKIFNLREKDKNHQKNEKKAYNYDDMKKKNIFMYKDPKKESQNNNNNKIDKKTLKKNKLLELQMANDIILQNLAKIKDSKKRIEEQIKKNNLKINTIQIKHKNAKANYTEKVQMLSEYYYQILKKGIDVRKSGLSWVVVRLMELNAYIDKNHFPSFLNDSEINYLLRIGVKTFELNELVKLFQLLKIRQKKLRERHVQEDKDKENKIKEDKFNKLKEAHKGNKFNIGNDYVEYMEEIQRKYESVINICLNEKTEENDINQISEKFKKQILTMQDDALEDLNTTKLYELYFIPGSLAQYFSKDKVFRQYFDDIYYLNEEINKRRKELKEEKEKEYKKYRNFNSANYYIKTVSGVQIIERSQRVSENDKIMAALFGNDISV